MSDVLISVNKLTVRFSHDGVINDTVNQVSFTIEAGQCVGLVGESGSGKSMTALAMMQLLPNAARVGSASSIMMHGKDLLQYSQRQIRKVRGESIAMVFQDASTALNPVKTVAQQIKEVLQLHTTLTTQQIKKRIIHLLQEVGIRDPKHCYNCYPHELSGGMRQRVMIAMALGCEPELLIADEPTTALDVTVQAQVIDLLKSLQRKHGMAMLFISHDLAVVSQLADSIVVLRQGEVVESSTASEFFSQPKHPYSQHLLRSLPDMQVKQTLEDASTLLQVDHLKVYFPIKKGLFKHTVGHVRAVDDVSFAVNEGQTLAIVGESGSGKTTTGKALVRLLRQTQGQIRWRGQDIATLTRQGKRQWHSNIQMIFQDPYAALNPRIRIFDSIVEGLVAQRQSQTQAQLVARVDELLEQVCLPLNAKWCYPHEFSGGERQRICVARALALQPTCLILDEPTSSLDVSIQMQVLQLLVDLQQQHQLSYILITHNISVVATLAHTVMVMYQGKAVEQGATRDVLFSPQHPYTQQLLRAVPVLAATPIGEE